MLVSPHFKQFQRFHRNVSGFASSMIAGMTGSGKTSWVRSLLQQASETIYPSPGEERLVLFTMAACVYTNISRHATH